jgi:hypothetical protein
MPRTTNAAGRIRDESLMNLGGRENDIRHNDSIDSSCVRLYHFYANLRQNRSVIVK